MHFTFLPLVGPFYEKIATDMGIAIILAVSLNIVNGMTGQFSLGHAAFMALGGYAAGMITYYGSMLLWGIRRQAWRLFGLGRVAICRWPASSAESWRRRPVTSLGCRRCDCKGDYLAIVTLGFRRDSARCSAADRTR